MNAMPPESMPARAMFADRPGAADDQHGLAARWGAIHEAAAVVGALAGLAPEPVAGAAQAFPAAIARAGGQRLAVARQGMADLSVILETGIRALLSIHGRGASPQAAARALWAEFCAARDALVALAPPERRLLG